MNQVMVRVVGGRLVKMMWQKGRPDGSGSMQANGNVIRKRWKEVMDFSDNKEK